MAKKVIPAMANAKANIDKLKSEGKVFSQPGQARKECPSCHHIIYFQAATCPVCGHAFPRKPRNDKVKGIQINAETMRALKALHAYVEGKGGIDAGVDLLDQVQDLVEIFGSIAAVKSALESLAE